MSIEYDRYLDTHIENVIKGFKWLESNLPNLVLAEGGGEFGNIFTHDVTKRSRDEYRAYDEYFYGDDRSDSVMRNFNEAWLKHIHRNKHHWQHWVLINDDPEEGAKALDMPYHYIIEMICDWWAFSWSKGDLTEIFKWYDDHKEHIMLSDKTRSTVEMILGKIKEKLEELK